MSSVATILIIEQDATARQLLVEFVVELGHQASGPDDLATGPGPDLVVLEPADEASLVAARALRERDGRLPIVCVSSAHPDEDVEALRPSAYLMKPFRGRLLAWAISEALADAHALAAA